MGIFKNSRSHYIEDFTVHIFQDQKKNPFSKENMDDKRKGRF